MKHFICEFITAGGMRYQDLPESLQLEGRLMFETLAGEVTKKNDVEIITTYDNRIKPLEFNNRPVEETDDIWSIWHSYIGECDYFWPIAPETDGFLYRLTSLANRHSCQVIGSTAEAIEQCSSKYKLACVLKENRVQHIPTFILGDEIPDTDCGWVIKPDTGAGCEECYHIQDEKQLYQFIQQCTDLNRFVIQPYMQGIALSLSTLMYQGESVVLAGNRQQINNMNGKFFLAGLEINAFADQRESFLSLTNNIAGLFPGLAGFVGIDLVLHEDLVAVVEINPRITTALSGLSRSIGGNVTNLILDLFIHKCLPEMSDTVNVITLNFNSH